GFVLSNPAETYANQAVQIASSRFRRGFEEGLEYIFSPIVIILIIITVISVVVGLRQAKTIMAEGAVASGAKRAPLIFLLAVLGYLLFAFTNASLIPDYASADRIFPQFVSGVAIVGALILLVQMMRRPESDPLFADREAGNSEDNRHGLWSTLAWFAGLLVLTALVGFVLALAIFLLTFIRFRAGRSWPFAATYTVAGITFICFMAWTLNRDFPAGLLQDFVRLPWPLG
ncbi:MAG: tripartite tricarboxylate transporter TctB family protein, partial [Pseudomonadota bacterium]